jgi:hypothetical protein
MMRAVVIGLSMVVAVIVLAGAAPVTADVTITMENTVKAGGREETTTVLQYYTPTKMRNEYGESSISIIDLDEACSITLIPAAKMYMKQTFEAMRQAMAAVKLPEQKVTIEETEDQETISGYECHKVIVKTAQANHETVTEYWVAKDVDGIDDVKAFLEGMAEAFKDSPMHRRDSETMAKLTDKGYFPIRTVLTIPGPDGGSTVTMTVTKIEVGDLADELFEAPDDYKEANFGGAAGGVGSR